MRYQGQNYEQEVAVPEGTIDEAALTEVYAEYGRLYEGFYGYRLDGIPIELVRLSVVAMGEPPVFAGLPSEDAEGEGPARRDVFFPETGFVSTDIVRRQHLAPGDTRSGPLIVESMDSTVVVPPGWELSVAATGILDLTRA
jgi:N-methylhydantoinase A